MLFIGFLRKATDGVTIERQIETQRRKLLRLVAGWLAVVAFMTAAPFAPSWTRWVRALLSSLLDRADAAAQCLLFVEARRIAEAHEGRVDQAWLSRQFDLLTARDADEPPSLAALRRRAMALRCLLDNLSRRAARLLGRMATWRVSEEGSNRHTPEAMRCLQGLFADGQCCPPNPWHPPRTALQFRIL